MYCLRTGKNNNKRGGGKGEKPNQRKKKKMLSRMTRIGGKVLGNGATVQKKWYCVAAPSAGVDRDPRCILQSNNEMMYLRSPRTILFKAETSIDLTMELMTALAEYKDSPRKCLGLIDAMSTLMCLAVDPAEFIRCIHPREEYRSHAEKAYNECSHYLNHMNTSRAVYQVVVKLSDPEHELYDILTPEEKHLAHTLKDEMESTGVHFSPRKSLLVQKLLEKNADLTEMVFKYEESTRDPDAILHEIIANRYELATTVGYDSYVAWTLRNTLAESPLSVWSLLLRLADKLQHGAREELQLLIESREAIAGLSKPVEQQHIVSDSELRDMSSIYKKRTFGEVEKEISEYLSVQNVWEGVKILCEQVFELTLKEVDMDQFEKYDKNLMKFEVLDSKKQLIGVIYADLLARTGKTEGSGHFTIQLGSDFDPTACSDLDIIAPEANRLLPIVVFSCNYEGKYMKEEKPEKGHEEDKKLDRLLLTPNDAVSLFHEFGHALHTLLGQTKFQILSGTRSSMDYVEVFSQLFEVYAREYVTLRKWATHYETGLPISRELVDKMNDSESSFSNLQQLEEIVSSLVDLVYHGPRPMMFFTLDPETKNLRAHSVPEGQEDPLSLRTLIADSITPITVTELGNARNFSHSQIVNYPGTYYSYTYSRVFATAIWEKYFKNDPYSISAGKALASVMKKGASASPKALIGQLVSTSPEDLLDAF
eukprot:TRINITY_DN10264_c0_g1_i1.p1 TRINITY_DN10264_c0_g1~~TRINITY_DN10264_c0_g1_i1.p1  ORF type:complete len:708 (+),score=145.23 TRINITY_DN10264_c0_g1_i1:76-2199(+)